MQISNRHEFNVKLRNMLWAGIACYILFSFAVYLACNNDKRVFAVFMTGATLIFINSSLLGVKKLNLDPLRGSSLIMALTYLISGSSVISTCYMTNWPNGSYLMTLIICLVLMEVQFILNKNLARFVFFIMFFTGVGVFSFAPDALNLRLQFIIAFVALSRKYL